MKTNIRDITYCTVVASFFSVGLLAAVGNFWYKTFFKAFWEDSREVIKDVFDREGIPK